MTRNILIGASMLLVDTDGELLTNLNFATHLRK